MPTPKRSNIGRKSRKTKNFQNRKTSQEIILSGHVKLKFDIINHHFLMYLTINILNILSCRNSGLIFR